MPDAAGLRDNIHNSQKTLVVPCVERAGRKKLIERLQEN